jgi:hypothetical protein
VTPFFSFRRAASSPSVPSLLPHTARPHRAVLASSSTATANSPRQPYPSLVAGVQASHIWCSLDFLVRLPCTSTHQCHLVPCHPTPEHCSPLCTPPPVAPASAAAPCTAPLPPQLRIVCSLTTPWRVTLRADATAGPRRWGRSRSRPATRTWAELAMQVLGLIQPSGWECFPNLFN